MTESKGPFVTRPDRPRPLFCPMIHIAVPLFSPPLESKGADRFLSRCGVKTSWVDLERTPCHGTMTDYPRWPPCAIVLCCDHRDQILLRISMRRTVISDLRRSMSRIAFFFFVSFSLSLSLSLSFCSWLMRGSYCSIRRRYEIIRLEIMF